MRESLTSRIGVFDSGVGGLTVLRELYRQLPQESILYFADTARLPYGVRSAEEIIHFVRGILNWMEQQRVKMVVMACNTSSALALEQVQEEYPFPILGVILPGAKAAVKQGKRIGVIATPATAKSHAYRQAIHEINSDVSVWEVGCPKFVPLIEGDRIYDPYTRTVAQEYLHSLIEKKIDTLVYGCTHYRHLSPIIQELLPNDVTLIDPAISVVQAIVKEVNLMGLSDYLHPQPTRFCVSGCPRQFAQLSRQWLGYRPTVEKVMLPLDLPASVSLELAE
ncbi:MAG: glutamate racemase [Microcystaceae cyanobacterium]